eukprot:363073-Chlamydomonas_euryale.AAC.10
MPCRFLAAIKPALLPLHQLGCPPPPLCRTNMQLRSQKCHVLCWPYRWTAHHRQDQHDDVPERRPCKGGARSAYHVVREQAQRHKLDSSVSTLETVCPDSQSAPSDEPLWPHAPCAAGTMWWRRLAS